jgi:rod shape-determining protein MreC
MRNIFLFIRRYFTFFAFLVLQVIALSFLFRYNKYHRAVGMGVANEITGWFNTRYSKFDRYFHLNEENTRLHKLNDSLLNLQKTNFYAVDTSVRLVQDSIPFDTLGHYRRYYWRDAEVVYNSINLPENYIQINRGSKQGIRDNMGVLNSDGSLVGSVITVSDNFSQVRSLINVQSTVSVVMKRSGNMGTITWDGKNPLYLTLTNIPKSDSIAIGDTVLTGPFSSFPPGSIVGTVDDFVKSNSGNTFYTLKIRAAANFQNLQHVHVVENLAFDEQDKLMKDTKKKMDALKPKN